MKKQNKLKQLAILGGSMGLVLVIYGICMEVFDLTFFGFAFPNRNSAPWGFCLVGLLILLVAVAPWFDESSKTKLQRIEDQDERNLLILYLSSYYAFSFLMGVGTIALLFLTMLGYMNKVSFFTLCGIFVASFLIQMVVKYHLNDKL